MNMREECINRMLRILDRFIRKLSIAIYLPILLKQKGFYEICKNYRMRDVEIFRQLNAHGHNEDYPSIEEGNRLIEENFEGSMEVAVVEREYHGKRKKRHLQWPVILEFLIKYENEIKSILDEIEDEIEPIYKETINHVESLKQIMEWQMRLSPKGLRERRTELRNAKSLISRKEGEIEKLESDICDETVKYNEAIGKSQVEISDLNNVIETTSGRYREELEREMNDYETASRRLRRDSLEERSSLFNQLKAHGAMLETLTQANLEQEKSLRELSKEAEEKYLHARNTYDRDLGKLNELKETLEVQLRVTNRHLDILRSEYDVQSVLFINLRKERELALMQAFAEQLDNFEKNRAARIIQRTWRAYHQRISTKKKKKTRRAK